MPTHDLRTRENSDINAQHNEKKKQVWGKIRKCLGE